MGRALLVSLAFHALALLLIPALALTPSSTESVETITFARIVHIQAQPPEPRRPAPRALAPERSNVVLISETTRHELAHTTPHRVSSPPPAVAYKRSTAAVVAEAARPGAGTAPGDAAPQSSAPPAPRTVSSTVGRDVGGNLPFGAEQPDPVLDPGVRKQLDSLGVHVTIVVTVGEDGRTKNVAFQPPVDPQMETRIESLLADANWDPAVCGGGISCQGRATIKL